MYLISPVLYGSMTSIPGVIVDKYIKLASFCQLKALLWISKNQGGNFSMEEIAKSIGSSVADTKEAIDFWVNEGIVITAIDEIKSVPSEQQSDKYLSGEKSETSSPAAVKETVKKAPDIEISRPTGEQIAARLSEDKEIEGLLNHIQIMLGRTIGKDLQSIIIMFIDTYGLSADVILTLIQYCVDLNKASNAFILSVGKSWYEKDITTLELANKYIDEHNEAQKIYKEFAVLTGISAPNATPKQQDYFISWHRLGFTVEMMVLAYNETVERTGKISFAYTNKILHNWNENGLKTPEAVENSKKAFKEGKAAEGKNGRSYDIEKTVYEDTHKDIVFKRKTKRGAEDEV
ncbi:MAG: DnaD domain protein [Clostridia bacterium]|nr:DnaD domain protein [Clostridia bacterium]